MLIHGELAMAYTTATGLRNTFEYHANFHAKAVKSNRTPNS